MMTEYQSSEDFFRAFEKFVRKIDDEGHIETAKRLREGFSCLNGLTDGWAMLMESMEATVSRDQGKLHPDDMKELEGMLAGVRKAVYRT